MKRKLGNKVSMLVIEDFIIAYNWGPAKEPVKIPPLTSLENEEDFETLKVFIIMCETNFQF